MWRTLNESELSILTGVSVERAPNLECPFCMTFHVNPLAEFLQGRPKDVQVVYVSYPLRSHRFGLQGARVTECIRNRVNAAKWFDVVFSAADSLGLRDWSSYAAEAGVSDTSDINKCATDATAVPVLDSSVAFGQRMGLRGTPSVIVNGWRFDAPPSRARMDSVIAKGAP